MNCRGHASSEPGSQKACMFLGEHDKGSFEPDSGLWPIGHYVLRLYMKSLAREVTYGASPLQAGEGSEPEVYVATVLSG